MRSLRRTNAIYKENYKHQYVDLFTIIRGIPHKIKKSEIPKIVKSLTVEVVATPPTPSVDDVILTINTIEVTWQDILNVHIHFSNYSPYSNSLKRKLSIVLRGKKFRWIVTDSNPIHLKTQILELSRQGYA